MNDDDPADNRDLAAWLRGGLDPRKGKTQTKLAKLLGATQPRISEMIHGKRRFQVDEISKIAKFIERPPPSGLLENANHPSPSVKGKGEIRFALHVHPTLVWVQIFRNDKLIDQFEADAADLDNLSRQVHRAIQSLPKPK